MLCLQRAQCFGSPSADILPYGRHGPVAGCDFRLREILCTC
jgi:hypothetical protein